MRLRVLFSLLLSVLLGSAVIGCASGPLPAPADGPVPMATEYRLGASDKVRVLVFGEDSLSGEYVVSGAGMVAMPLIGDVPATGLTSRELAQSMERRFSEGFLRQPRVSVEVLNYRPYYILGEISAPGEYPYTSGLTVLNAVATAKGFTYRADQRRVFIKRAGENIEREIPLTSATIVQPGDTIRIGERYF